MGRLTSLIILLLTSLLRAQTTAPTTQPSLTDDQLVTLAQKELGPLFKADDRDKYLAVHGLIETWFATTARDIAASQESDSESAGWDWWRRGGFDHVERHDDRVQLFATRLAEGLHEFSYVVRATTSGTFRAAPTHVEEMYEPEVFGRTPSAVVTVKP